MVKKIIKNILGQRTIIRINELRNIFSTEFKNELAKRKNFYNKFINKGDLCFDVGANFGNRIDSFLKLGARVLAVEPQKKCYDYLKLKYGKRIDLVTKGLCEKECVRKFHISNVSVISSFSDEWINSVKAKRFSHYNWDKTVDVEMTTLDNLINEYGVPAFIKIDVEGYELEVLKGLSSPINMLSFEYTVPEQSDKAEQCINAVKQINSNIYCNYSIGESMQWALDEWVTSQEFLELMKTNKFLHTGFGDIYLKSS